RRLAASAAGAGRVRGGAGDRGLGDSAEDHRGPRRAAPCDGHYLNSHRDDPDGRITRWTASDSRHRGFACVDVSIRMAQYEAGAGVGAGAGGVNWRLRLRVESAISALSEAPTRCDDGNPFEENRLTWPARGSTTHADWVVSKTTATDTRNMKKLALFAALAAMAVGAPIAGAKDASNPTAAVRELTRTPAAELPAAAAKLVAATPKQSQPAMVNAIMRKVARTHPVALHHVVAAVAKVDPELASVAAASAARAHPEGVMAIVNAACNAAPDRAAEILA